MCDNDEQSVIYTKIANTARSSQLYVQCSVQQYTKNTNISIKKPNILISILNKYLDIPIYLDNRTPLVSVGACVRGCMCMHI